MAEFKILQENGVDIYPITHPNAVMDENGKSVTEMIDEVRDDWELIGETIFTEDTPTTTNNVMFNKPYGYKKIMILIDQSGAATLFNGRIGLWGKGRTENPNTYIYTQAATKYEKVVSEVINGEMADVETSVGNINLNYPAPLNTLIFLGIDLTYYNQGIDGVMFVISKIYANTKVTIYGIKK